MTWQYNDEFDRRVLVQDRKYFLKCVNDLPCSLNWDRRDGWTQEEFDKAENCARRYGYTQEELEKAQKMASFILSFLGTEWLQDGYPPTIVGGFR